MGREGDGRGEEAKGEEIAWIFKMLSFLAEA